MSACRRLALAALFLSSSAAGVQAGPSVKKTDWHTLTTQFDATRATNWVPLYGGTPITGPECPAGQSFLITQARVTPRFGALRAGGEGIDLVLTALQDVQVTLWHRGDGVAQTTESVFQRGSGPNTLVVDAPAGIPTQAGPLGLRLSVRATMGREGDWLRSVRFAVTLTGACGVDRSQPFVRP